MSMNNIRFHKMIYALFVSNSHIDKCIKVFKITPLRAKKFSLRLSRRDVIT